MVVGDTSTDVFRLRSGTLDVAIGSPDTDQESHTAQIRAGGLVGELAALAGAPRTATIVAAEPCELMAYTKDEFETLMAADPVLADEVTQIAIRRLDRNAMHAFIARHLGELDAGLQQSIEQHLTWSRAPAGTVIVESGTTGETGRVVLSGRLQGTDNRQEVTEYGPGSLLNPEAVVAPVMHTQTVIATRDTTVLEATRDDFEAVLVEHPAAVLAITRAIADGSRSVRTPAITVTVAITTPEPVDVVDIILGEMAAHGTVEHVDSSRANKELGLEGIADSPAGSPRDYRLSEYLHHLELSTDHLVLEADASPTEWTNRTIRQADRLVIISSAKPDESEHQKIADIIQLADTVPIHHRWLGLIHPIGTDRPRGTRLLMDRHNVTNVAHVLTGRAADAQRLARLTTGHSTSLVFGGGGARGFAHLGVLRSLEGAGVPVDTIVGTSIGSVLAAFYATGGSHAVSMQLTEKHFADVLDYTIPVVALIKGEKIARGLEEVFGDTEIEDLWHPFACVSTNLTQSCVHVHRTGRVALAVRASLAIPGVIPPVPFGDDLLVDGGVLNNLPIDVAQQQFFPGTIIAVDVAPRTGPHAKTDFGMSVSGWRAVADKIRHVNHFPGTAAILLRSMVTASIRERDRLVDDKAADLYLLLPTRAVAMMDFHESRKVEGIGYDLAKPLIEEWLANGGWPNATPPAPSSP